MRMHTWSVVLAAPLAVTLGGCGNEAPEPAPVEEATQAPEEEVDTYTVRGRIVSLPDADDPQREHPVIYHEAIDDFRRRDGSLGMGAMQMPFPLGDDGLIAGFNPGDAVRVTFVVSRATMRFQVTEIEALPENTRLDFEAGEP